MPDHDKSFYEMLSSFEGFVESESGDRRVFDKLLRGCDFLFQYLLLSLAIDL